MYVIFAIAPFEPDFVVCFNFVNLCNVKEKRGYNKPKYSVSPSSQGQGGELEIVRNIFQLQIIEEDGDTQLSLRWMEGDNRKVETDICSECKTIELNGKLVSLVDKLFGETFSQKSLKNKIDNIFNELINYLCIHINNQINAGADVVQIFDTWAGYIPKKNLNCENSAHFDY